jgi:hypothetical protein
VASAHGAPTPGEGEHDLNAGTLLTCSVAGSPDPIGDGARSLCTGWEGKGSLPPVGTATNTLPFGLTAATTVTWLWKTQYWVEASADAGGTVAPTNAWRDSGSAVTLTASAPQGFIFTAWTGDATCRSNPLVLPVNRPYRLTARFTPEAPRLSSIELNPGTPAGSWQVGYSVRSNVPPPVVEWISNPLTGQWSTNGVTQAGPVVPGTNGLWTGSAQGPLGEGAVLMRLRIGDGP